jgi:hypothetical protein
MHLLNLNRSSIFQTLLVTTLGTMVPNFASAEVTILGNIPEPYVIIGKVVMVEDDGRFLVSIPEGFPPRERSILLRSGVETVSVDALRHFLPGKVLSCKVQGRHWRTPLGDCYLKLPSDSHSGSKYISLDAILTGQEKAPDSN